MAIGTCSAKECLSEAHRHLFGYYFCNDCNQELRESLVEEDPNDPEEYIAAQTNERSL